LNHPNILTIHEVGQTESAHFIATEFIEGETLRQRLTRAPIPLIEALDITIQIASALSAAHAAGIVHRDIKPENIMVRQDGYIKVLDFGIAKLTEKTNEGEDTDPEAATKILLNTSPGIIMGTVSYMSPEQSRGLTVDARTDIWSLGVVLYEMVENRVPFAGATMSHMIVSILDKEPAPLTQHPGAPGGELERVVIKALAKDREQRYQRVSEMLIDLRHLKQEMEFQAKLRGSGQSSTEMIGRSSGEMVLVNSKPAESSSPKLATPRSTRKRKIKAIDSLAVLPFINASADADAEYLSDGITESIINNLSQLSRLRVMARSTVFRYKGREFDPQEVGQELGVRAVLLGRVVQLGQRLSIRAELVDVADGAQLWGELYQCQMADIFDVQEEIAHEIFEKLRVRLTSEQRRRLGKRHTESPEAYQAYLKGRYYWNKRTEEGLKKSTQYFQQAVEIDPAYAPAYAGLADSYALPGIAEYGLLPPREAMPRARAAAQRALEIDDTLAEAQTTLAHVRAFYDWDWPSAEQEFKQAIRLDPNYPFAHHWYALYLAAMGRHAEAIAEEARAQEIDPLSLIISKNVGTILYYAGQLDQSIEQYRKALDLDPNFARTHIYLGLAYERQEQYEEAIAEYQEALRISGGGTVLSALLGHAQALSGNRAEAIKIIDRLKEQSERQYVPAFNVALIYAGLGQNDLAFEWLDRAFEERSSWLVSLNVEPMLDSLRSDPRFTGLLSRLGLAS
jgi:serine/threonine protein kinase/tetratricopeptide (TPR) repeat protein